jgi:hypothetical protein
MLTYEQILEYTEHVMPALGFRSLIQPSYVQHAFLKLI